MKRILAVLAVLFAVGIAVVPHRAGAGDLTGADIIGRMDSLGSVADLTAQMEMRTIRQSETRNYYKMSLVMKGTSDGGRKMLIRVLAPATIKGTAVLSISRPGVPDETWLYLPALGKPKRISAGERGGSFMGSDFSYEDMGLMRTNDYRYTLTGTEEVDGEEMYVVESVPVSENAKASAGYARKIWWVRKDTFTRARSETRSSSGKTLKVMRSWNVIQLASNSWFTKNMETTSVQSGSSTQLTFLEMKTNTGVSDALFSVDQMGKK